MRERPVVKIAHIGAGSAGFGKTFLTDILTRPALQGATLALMDVHPGNLATMTTLARRIAEQVGSSVRLESTTDRRRALDGADYVIVTIVADGFTPRHAEHDIPRRYGVLHTSGCTA